MAKPLTPIGIGNLRARRDRYEVPDGGCQGLRVVVFPEAQIVRRPLPLSRQANC
jgi:hypothetical protein